MIGIPIDSFLINSLSVLPEEVRALQLRPFEPIYCKGERRQWREQVVIMADRLDYTKGKITCTMIRQVLVSPDEAWGQDYAEIPTGLTQRPQAMAALRKVRAWARAHNCPVVTVPGGIPPLTREGIIAIPDFAMSGTSWRLVPEASLFAHTEFEDVEIIYSGAQRSVAISEKCVKEEFSCVP